MNRKLRWWTHRHCEEIKHVHVTPQYLTFKEIPLKLIGMKFSSTDNYFFVQIKSDPRNLSGKWWTVSYLHRLFPVHGESKKKLETVVYCKPNCRYPPWCHNMSLPFQREENCLRKLFQWKWKVICPLIH